MNELQRECLKADSFVSNYITIYCVKNVRIRSYSGPYFPAFGLNTERYGDISPYSVQMWGNTDQNNPEYRYTSRSDVFSETCLKSVTN